MKKKKEYLMKYQVCGKSMKKVCLDTDFLIALLRGKSEAVKKAKEYDSLGVEVSTTSMNSFEIYLGSYRSKEVKKNVEKADDLFNSIKILNFTLESARKSSEILSELIYKGETIDLRDAIIAGIVLVNGYVLVTRNIKHFKRITGLSIETW